MGASLDCPTRQVIRSRFRKGTAWVTSSLPLYLVAFIFAGLGLGLGWKCKVLIVALGSCCQMGDEPHCLSSPWVGLKWMPGRVLSGHVAPSLASIAQEREQVSAASCTLSPCTRSLTPLLTAPSHHIFPHTFCQKTVGLGHMARVTLPLMESGWLLLPSLLHPHPWPHSWGLLWVLVWPLPHLVWSGQPLTGWSSASTWPFPPMVWWSLWPSPLPSPRSPHYTLHLLGSYHELGI